ncbi:hypothetical protein ACRALDRAFT_206153 [Sodiomyces alcalophilus JCM 7366]|uniref:uncharacterized protein n=1 Tax=Sodiomyces alcalophilus JCM 7366 TaxID=591952 RepID=UPI0039B570BA
MLHRHSSPPQRRAVNDNSFHKSIRITTTLFPLKSGIPQDKMASEAPKLNPPTP